MKRALQLGDDADQFANMDIDALTKLITDATARRRELIDSERADLKAKLAALDGYEAEESKTIESGNRVGNGKPRGPAPVKYQDDKGNKWSGRGATPTWLRAYEAEGRKREEFLI